MEELQAIVNRGTVVLVPPEAAKGARILGTSLRSNRTLTSLRMDGNNVALEGLKVRIRASSFSERLMPR